MKITKFTCYNRVGIQIYIDQNTKKPYLPVASYIRLSGVKRLDIFDRIKTILTENPDNCSFVCAEGDVMLINEEMFVDWIVGDNPELAKELIRGSGVRDYLYNLAGYDNYAERLVRAMSNRPKQPSELSYYLTIDFVVEYNKIEQPSTIAESRLICYSDNLNLPPIQYRSGIDPNLKLQYHRKVWGAAYPGLNYPD